MDKNDGVLKWTPEQTARFWNLHHPVGSNLLYWPDAATLDPLFAQTSGGAFVNDGKVLIPLAGQLKPIEFWQVLPGLAD